MRPAKKEEDSNSDNQLMLKEAKLKILNMEKTLDRWRRNKY
jgi:hypothetical protein